MSPPFVSTGLVALPATAPLPHTAPFRKLVRKPRPKPAKGRA